MSPLESRKLRFSDVVFAVETTPKAMRKWFQREQVKLGPHGNPDGWREFSYVDVCFLALIRKLVDFGMPVEVANNFAVPTILAKRAVQSLIKNPNAPAEALADTFAGESLIVWRDDSREWRIRIVSELKPNVLPADCYLTVRLQTVLRRALHRAVTGVDDVK